MRIERCLSIILLITTMFTALGATEFRAPLSTEMGPLRYVIDAEEWESSDYSLKLWSACYGRESHKAFMKHGTNTDHLSALFFNKSSFGLSEIFPNSCPDIATELYTPFLAVTNLKPRITYNENGLSVGARLAVPVYKNKGRVGLRVHVPFRKIEIEREDSGDKDTNQLDDLMTGEVVTRDSGDTTGAFGDATDVFARAIRLDFLQALPYTAERKPILDFLDSPQGLASDIGGFMLLWESFTATNRVNRSGVVIHSPEGTVPKSPDRKLGINQTPLAADAPTALPADGNISDDKQYYFAGTPPSPITDYSALDIHSCSAAAKAQAAQLWLTTVHAKGQGGSEFSTGTENLWNVIDLALKNFENENIYEWLGDRGFEFESNTRSGLGDIDLDFFYEHMFGDELVAEATIGVRFPTGSSDDYCGNPYKAHLGNGEHFEIRPGLLVAWQPIDWLNIKLDGRFSFVLSSVEKRMATFNGATIKNIGPCIDADVDWNYFIGNLDFNLFHPKTDAISTVIGYQFYYKTEDNICYKCASMESWLGKKFNTTTKVWDENKQTLDPCVDEMHTQAIAHRLRLETSFRISQWFELFCGGMYTFAGKNIPRECDCHGGFVVSF